MIYITYHYWSINHIKRKTGINPASIHDKPGLCLFHFKFRFVQD
jgi:hypothetical protein